MTGAQSHGWTHPLCGACYGVLQPGRKPFRLREEHREEEVCCQCLTETASGIYYRADPRELGCGAVSQPAKDR